MNDSMRKIVEADALARKALEETEKNRDALPKELEKAKEDIFRQYQQQAEETIREAKTESENRLESAKAEIHTKIMVQTQNMQQKFSDKKELWKAQILQHIIGD